MPPDQGFRGPPTREVVTDQDGHNLTGSPGSGLGPRLQRAVRCRPMTRVALVGPGSVGVFFAAHLAATGVEVVSCARRTFDTYVVESKDHALTHPATVVTDPAALAGQHFDWVLVGLKAHQTEGAADWFEAVCGPDTPVVVMQNGVEGVERLTPHAKGGEVIPTVVYCGASVKAPGQIRHSSSGHLITPVGETATRLQALFAPSPAEIRPTDTYVTEAWRKLGMNVTFNAITALTRQNIGICGHPDIKPLAFQVLTETWRVGRAEGAELNDDAAAKLLDMIGGLNEMTSMQQDRLAGRPTEWDALQGAVVRFGAKHGIATPYADTLARLLRGGDL